MRRRIIRTVVTLLYSAWLIPVQAEHGLALHDGALIDRGAKSAYIMSPGGGVTAVSIETGTTLWHSSVAGRPLSLDQGRLLAQTDASEPGKLELVVIDTGSGEAQNNQTVALPDSVVPAIDDGLGRHFRIKAISERQLTWQYERRIVQGMPSATAPPPQKSVGMLSADTGFAAVEAGDALTAKDSAALWYQPSLRATTPIPELASRQFDSRDGSHILVTRSDAADPVGVHRWSIYTPDGRLLGETRSPVSFTPFVVIGQRILFVTPPTAARAASGKIETSPLSLRAVDLESGEVLWERPLRDTRYYGPYPS